MHARFGHQEEAFNVLNEAIMMAQEGEKNTFNRQHWFITDGFILNKITAISRSNNTLN